MTVSGKNKITPERIRLTERIPLLNRVIAEPA